MSSDHSRNGARQPQRFDPAKAHVLDDPERDTWLPTYRIFQLLDVPPEAEVMDYGAGSGVVAIALARSRPDVFVYAIDEQAEMLAIMQAKLDERLTENVLPMRPDEAPPLHGRIDRLLAVNVLHEMGDVPVASLAPYLSADGTALFIDWNAAVERPVGPPSDHVYSAEEAAAKLRTAGFDPVAVGAFPYHFAFRCTITRS